MTQALGPQLAAEQVPAQPNGDRCALSKKTFPEEAGGPSLALPTAQGTGHIKHPWQGWHNTAESVCSDTGVPRQHQACSDLHWDAQPSCLVTAAFLPGQHFSLILKSGN